MMSLIYEGHFYSFPPITHLDRTNLTVIRPLMYVSEADVKGFCRKYQLPVVKSPCPADGYTKRQYVKDLLRKLNLENPGVKERMFSAIINGNISDWTPRIQISNRKPDSTVLNLINCRIWFSVLSELILIVSPIKTCFF